MKHLTLILALTIGFAPMAFAMDDDFGAPFTDQAPAGLEDANDTTLSIENIAPELIEPAAGDEMGADEPNAQNPAPKERDADDTAQ